MPQLKAVRLTFLPSGNFYKVDQFAQVDHEENAGIESVALGTITDAQLHTAKLALANELAHRRFARRAVKSAGRRSQ